MKDIDGYEGKYSVADDGRVWSHAKKGRWLTPTVNSRGYLYVFLTGCGKKKAYRVHRIVAEAFISNPEKKPQVNHLNGNKLDNRVENLAWVTASENLHHAYDSGLKVAAKGESHGRSKLSASDVASIRATQGITLRELAAVYGVSRGQIYLIRSGKSWPDVQD